jgi:curved DNA-binding protein CbpA
MPSAADFDKQDLTLSDPYLILQLDRRASDAEIKRAYFQLFRQYPPEREAEKFQQIRAAYEQLRTPQKRALVDLFLLQPPPDLPNRRRPSYDLAVHIEDLMLMTVELVATPMEKDFQP